MKSGNSLQDLAREETMEIAKGLASMAQLAIQEEMKIATQLALRDIVIDAATKHSKGAGKTSKGMALDRHNPG